MAEEEEDEVDTWVVVEEVEAGEADEAVVEEVRFLDTFIHLSYSVYCLVLVATCLILI